MVSNGNEKLKTEIHEVESVPACAVAGAKDENTLSVQNVSEESKQRNRFLNFVNGFSGGARLRKFGPSPSAKFRQIALERDEFSRSIHSESHGTHNHFHLPFIQKVNWAHLRVLCKSWIKEPLNMALFVWIVCVAVSGAILFLVLTGMLNRALPSKSQRDTWFEVNNQILNALFTLMCLYQHPQRLHNLVLLCRWEQKDILTLRRIYCKNGTYKPNEWMHMMVVVILLNLNCFAQYALCSLNLGYRRSRRPPIGVAVCISVAIGAAAFAGLYNIVSSLGKDYDIEVDQEAQVEVILTESSKPATSKLKSLERRYSFILSEERRFVESRPEWVGGLLDFWDNISLAYLSIFCSCCVFGWNMQRLGFGNMYVHIATFVLFCLAPFFIFNLAAVNINSEIVRQTLGLTGLALCFFGLLYGGFWRIQMRKRFNLPGNNFCCSHPSIMDCFQWLCCCSCSLAQEVRTADYYDIAEDKSYTMRVTEETHVVMSPLPREDGLPLFKSTPNSPYRNSTTSPSIFITESPLAPQSSSDATQMTSLPVTGDKMKAPTLPIIQKGGVSESQHEEEARSRLL